MKRNLTRRATPIIAIAAASALLIAGCGGNVKDESVDSSNVALGNIGNQPEPGDPVQGGSLSFATYSSVTGLDPASGRQDTGATGATEMAAIYDLLIRYDAEAQEYAPQLAESLSGNGDNSVWTLKLRPGVKFNDGTPVDADSIVWSINRYLSKKGTYAQVWLASVKDMRATDGSTVVFTLQRPWDEFPVLFTSGPGLIVAPSSEATGTFSPVGAGPFTVEKHKPNEELVLTARDDYYGGKPRLATLRFPAIVSESGKLEALHSGGIQAAYLRNSENVHNSMESGDPGFVFSANAGGAMSINSREGRAGSDVRVRKAIVAGVDPELYNDRAQAGTGLPGSDLFQADTSKWHGDVKGSGFDPEAAKKYLDQAKADGYDGKLTLVAMNEASAQRGALAFQSMLNSVGFDVEIVYATDIANLVKTVYAEKNFDISYTGFNIMDASPFVRLYSNLYSESPASSLGYQNPEMDKLLIDLQSAQGDDAKQEVIDQIQTLINGTAPFVTIAAGKNFIPWSKNVYELKPGLDGIVLFDKAWVAEP